MGIFSHANYGVSCASDNRTPSVEATRAFATASNKPDQADPPAGFEKPASGPEFVIVPSPKVFGHPPPTTSLSVPQ